MKKYKYYRFTHLDTILPVYACDGTNEAQSAFRADAEAMGMEARTISIDGKEISFAADVLDNGAHTTALDQASEWFYKLNRVPLKAGYFKLDGPIPKNRQVTVCTVWQRWGRETITLEPGQTLQEALDEYIENAPLPDDSEYVDGSHEIDYNAGLMD